MIRSIRLVILVFLCSILLIGCNTENVVDTTQKNTDTENKQSEIITSTERVTSEDRVNEEPESDTQENEEIDPNEIPFNNYKSLTYTVTENGSYASIKRANYMPELRTVCIDVTIKDSSSVTYIARLGRSSNANEAYSSDKIFNVDYSGESTYLCFNELKNGENYIHIIRSVSINTWATVELTFHYNDEEYDNRSKLTNFDIRNKTESSVELGVDPNITIDLILNGDKEAIGRLVLKVFDTGTGEVVHKNEFNKDDLIFNGTDGTIVDYKIDGLSPGYKYHVALLFYPASNIDETILLDKVDLYATSIIGLNSTAQYHKVYADIHGVDYNSDTTTFKTYIKKDNSFVDPSTNEPYSLNFNVYSEDNQLLYTTSVVNQQEAVVIPNEFLFIGGYVTISIEGLNKVLSREPLTSDHLNFNLNVTNDKAVFQIIELPSNLLEVKIEIWDRSNGSDVLIAVYDHVEITSNSQELEYNQQVQIGNITSYRYKVTYKWSYFNKEVTASSSSYIN